MFDTSRFRKVGNIQGKDAKPDIFKRRGGKLYGRTMSREISKLPLSRAQKEYAKQAIGKHDRPGSPGITRAEFLHALEEMEKNPRDPVTRKDVDTIKKYF